MSEIKSTLDLVMERTRHLSLSAEEKNRQQQDDFQKRLQGLLQLYADAALSVDELHDRTAALQQELKIADGRIAAAVLGRIDPDQDGPRWLELLADLAPAVVKPLEQALTVYRKNQADLLRTARQRMLARLAEAHGIAGSAVVPNPDRDPAYNQSRAGLRTGIQKQIENIGRQAP